MEHVQTLMCNKLNLMTTRAIAHRYYFYGFNHVEIHMNTFTFLKQLPC